MADTRQGACGAAARAGPATTDGGARAVTQVLKLDAFAWLVVLLAAGLTVLLFVLRLLPAMTLQLPFVYLILVAGGGEILGGT